MTPTPPDAGQRSAIERVLDGCEQLAEVVKDLDELDEEEAFEADMLLARAELRALRSRLQRAEAVVEAARAMADYHPRTATDTLLYAALRAFDAAASAEAGEHRSDV